MCLRFQAVPMLLSFNILLFLVYGNLTIILKLQRIIIKGPSLMRRPVWIPLFLLGPWRSQACSLWDGAWIPFWVCVCWEVEKFSHSGE